MGAPTGMGAAVVPTWTMPAAWSSSAAGAPRPAAFQQNSARLADWVAALMKPPSLAASGKA